jgi:hypothetical protein
VPWVHRRIDIRRRTAPWPLSACSVDLKVAKGAAAQATDVGRRPGGELAAVDGHRGLEEQMDQTRRSVVSVGSAVGLLPRKTEAPK